MSKFLEYFNNLHFNKPKPKTMTLMRSQLDLLRLLATGMSLREIAEIMGKTYNNIHKRTNLLYEKFWVNSRKELIEEALKQNFIKNKDVKNRFRERFVKKSDTQMIVKAELTLKEVKFLLLKKEGALQKEIMKQLDLWSFYQYRQIRSRILDKLECKNLNQAVCILSKLEII